MKQRTIKITIIFAAILLLATSEALAYVVFDTNGVIQDGDVYDYVYVRNDAVVDMTGGVVTNVLGAEDWSIVNVSGGVLGRLGSGEFSTLNLSGDMETNEVEVHNSSTMSMFGGNVGLIEAWNYSTVNLYGGIISEYLKAYGTEDLVISIYGYGFEYDTLAGDYGGGQLSGFWLDDTPFSIDLFGDPGSPGGAPIDTYSHIVLIPEPATILLLGLGAIYIRIS